MDNTKIIRLELVTNFDGAPDVWKFNLIVPIDETEENVRMAIIKKYKELQEKDMQISMVYLMDCVIDEYDWRWEDFKMDVIIDFYEGIR